MGRCSLAAAVLLLLLPASIIAASTEQPAKGISKPAVEVDKHHKKKKQDFSSPQGLFIQERASKQLPGPGQHFAFGALQPWDDLLREHLLGRPNRKLLLIVRHGQAVSNWLSDTLGPDEWFKVEGTCEYKDKNVTWGVFDADLTELGREQASSLNSMLHEAGWLQKMTQGLPARAVISPLTRCLTTAQLVLSGLKFNASRVVVEEYARETLGEDTCDARRSVSDPGAKGSPGPCPFKHGLASKFPQFRFPVLGEHKDGFGLLSDHDELWTPSKREKQTKQVKRAKKFLKTVFKHSPENVVVVISHSGFTRSVLLAAGREPYRPANAELVPLIVQWDKPHESDVESDYDDEE